MNSKILLLSIAVISVGLFAMPSTLSLFAGQHSFYNRTDASGQCAKCHQDIYSELSNPYGGQFGTSNAHNSTTGLQSCKGCHTTGNIGSIPLNKSNSSGWYNGTNITASGAHAAVTIECAACHSGVPDELMNTSEAHGAFYNSSKAQEPTNGTAMLKGANEACVGCHTHININIKWRRPVGYNMTVNISTEGVYTVSFAANTSVNITTAANGSIIGTN